MRKREAGGRGEEPRKEGVTIKGKRENETETEKKKQGKKA